MLDGGKTARRYARRSTIVFAAAAASVLMFLPGCDDESSNGEDVEETCTGFACQDVRDIAMPDTSTTTNTTSTTGDDMDMSIDVEGPCEAGETRCADTQTLEVCNNDGVWEDTLCLAPDICVPGDDDAGTIADCGAATCPVPGLPFACEDEDNERVCGDDQIDFEVQPCETDEKCLSTGCTIQVCVPGQQRCKTASQPEVCLEDGSGFMDVEACDETELCDQTTGTCQSLCESNAKTSSFLGCEYFVVDMDNEGDADDTEFGITVSNDGGPMGNLTASVRITGPNNFMLEQTVSPGSLIQIPLPTDSDAEGSGIYPNGTFYVEASIPVTVHQFNPLNDEGVASNDASLLLPTNALGTEYMALISANTRLNPPTDNLFDFSCTGDTECWLLPGSFSNVCASDGVCKTQCSTDADCAVIDPIVTCGDAGVCEFDGTSTGYVDVVATADNTTVTVVSPIALEGEGSFGAVPANVPTNYTLNTGDLLHLKSPKTLGADISGLTVSASEPVAVFTGNPCTFLPDETAYCDHIEQQMFPTNTWGTTYVASKFAPRGNEVDIWRIIASEDDTTVTLTPPQDMLSTFTLAAGEVREFTSAADFVIGADKPVLAGQFMVGSNAAGIDFTCAGGLTGIGDPAFSLAVPVEQYRNDYIVMTPSGYAENYLTIIDRMGGSPIILDGTQITEPPYNATPTPLGTDYEIYRVQVGEGVHTLFSPSGTYGVMSYGYDCDVSYAYPGGLDLQIIN